MQKKPRPRTLTDFRKLGKRRLRGRSAEECKALHDARQAAHVRRAEWNDEARRPVIMGRYPVRRIPLGEHTISPTEHVRAKNWNANRGTTRRSYVKVHNQGKYSSRCTYTHYTYTQYIESRGAVVAGCLRSTIATDQGRQVQTFRPYRGWRWIVDNDGLALVDSQGKRDYHPTASDLLSARSTADIAAIARERDVCRKHAARQRRETEAAIRRAEREGARVCLLDSLQAGNCRAGSTTWAERHGFDPNRHYRPSEILASANGDASRVRLVVQCAFRRHRREIRQGYCDLREHVQF